MAERLTAIDRTQQTAAKVAGLAYLITVAFVVCANFGMRGPLDGDLSGFLEVRHD